MFNINIYYFLFKEEKRKKDLIVIKNILIFLFSIVNNFT